jgi:hypothetical protein
MNFPAKMGTLAQQLDFLLKNNLPLPETLNGRAVPKQVELNAYENWIVREWEEIGRSRTQTDSGSQHLTDTQIQSYIQLMQIELQLVDIVLIKDIDKAFIGELNEQRKLQEEQQ